MLDFFLQELTLGDTVAFYAPNYRYFTQGTVISFTPKKVRVEYQHQGSNTEYLAYPEMFIKKMA